MLVGGGAGIGKSRLVSALVDLAHGRDRRVLWGRTTELDGAPPYWPWIQVLEPVAARHLVEAPAGPDPASERFARFDAIVAALTEAPGLVVLEDMHRADAASLSLLAYVADRIRGTPVLVTATYRTHPADQVAGFAPVVDEVVRTPSAERLELAGLDRAGVATLLGPVGSQPPADAVVDAVVDASGGNPLYVGELARHLAAGGDLATVPQSVRDAIARRLAERSDGCVDAVRVGAVIGRTFSAGLVATATGRAALACLEDLDEAVAAGLIEPTGVPGEFRFVHALVRDAVEATLGAAELPARHRQVACAIETYEGAGDAQLAELARHWDAASVLGDRATAAQWCERAAVVADRQLAWEEAGRLFDRALELGGASASALDRFDRGVGAARAALHCDEVMAAVSKSVAAAYAAREAGRPDLVAEALLVPEGRRVEGTELRVLALETLGTLPVDDHARRARLHGLLTHLGYYGDPSTMLTHCEQAEAEAAHADDLLADLAAIRARHATCYGPEHAPQRLELARRLGLAARAADRPSIALWEPLWKIDALLELGRVPDAVSTLPDLRRAVAAAGAPIARWHLARVETALAQATGRLAESSEHALEARRLFAQLESPYVADGMYYGVRMAIELHAGWTTELDEAQTSIDLSQAPPFLGEMPLLGPALTAAARGDLDRARVAYNRMSPAAGWAPPPELSVQMFAVRIDAAVRIGVRDDLPALLAALEPHRGRHIGTGGGIVTYLGATELWLGIGEGALEQWDAAERDLAAAGDVARASGTPGFAVHADVERATVLLARRGPGDAQTARALLVDARPIALRLGMPDFLRRIDGLLDDRADDGPLSPRESEVAALVAEGRTNKEIAAALYLSERTAQNHVQHILTKLGLANRTQIAAWFRERAAAS